MIETGIDALPAPFRMGVKLNRFLVSTSDDESSLEDDELLLDDISRFNRLQIRTL